MTYTGNSAYLEGTETVSLYVTDSTAAVSVAYALVGELTYREAMQLGSLAAESNAIAVELDAASLSGSVPKRGSKITRTDGTAWRVQSVMFDHVIGVYRCLCTDIK